MSADGTYKKRHYPDVNDNPLYRLCVFSPRARQRHTPRELTPHVSYPRVHLATAAPRTPQEATGWTGCRNNRPARRRCSRTKNRGASAQRACVARPGALSTLQVPNVQSREGARVVLGSAGVVCSVVCLPSRERLRAVGLRRQALRPCAALNSRATQSRHGFAYGLYISSSAWGWHVRGEDLAPA